MLRLLKKGRSSGFTLIELLIVIAVIGLLAVALLSAINPAEQLKKSRDAARKSDAAELLNAYERFYTTFDEYPWTYGPLGLSMGTPANPVFTSGGNSAALITTSELKGQFTGRSTVVGLELWVSEDSGNNVHVCYEPESMSARNGGLGPLKLRDNTGAPTCGASYPDNSCYVCVPQ